MGPILTPGGNAIRAFDHWHDINQKLLSEEVDRFGRTAARPGPIGVAVWHHYDHRNGTVPRDEVVEDDPRASGVAPVLFVVAAAMAQVQDRKAPNRFGIVLRRRVDW